MMAVLRFAQAVQLSAKTYLVWVMLALLISWAAPVSDTYAQTVTDNATMMRAPPPPDEDAPPFNDARGVIQDVPRTMITNQVYDVWVMMKNTGTLEWNSWGNYRLGVIGGDYWGIGRVELPGIVPPDSSPTFRFQVRAPSTPGTYTFQWRMVQDGVEWFGVPSTAVTVTVRDPINNASYVSHYQTTEMQTGQRYDVSVTMYNNGESTWSRALEYTLMAQGPHNNTTWGFNRVPLPVAEVRPGESVTFTFPVTAPATAGAYISQWGMQRERYGSFGVSTNAVSVNVTAPYNDAQVVSVNVPARMQTRQSYNVAVTMRNSGTTTWAPGANYNLGSQNPHDNQIWGLGRVAVATPVAPGQQYTFNFPVTAPAPGDYTMQWGMVQDGVQWFGPGASSPVTVTEDLSRVTFIHTDGLGSPVARTDGNGNPVSQSRYEPYGYVASGATPTIGFTGHVNDADTGLTYMQQRYYDPVAGRFLSIDPVVTDANTGSSFNRYNYAKNNPFKFLDPDGRSASEPKDICAGLSRMNCGTVESSTAGRPKEFYDRSGVGPNLRGNEAVAIVEDELVSQGFIVLGREVVATTKGLEYTRRYDLVVLNPVSKNTFGVEIKSALYGPLKLNEKQVTFDVGVIKNGAVTTRGIEFDGIMYRGVDFGTKVQSVFRSATLLDKLKEAGVFPALTKPPHL